MSTDRQRPARRSSLQQTRYILYGSVQNTDVEESQLSPVVPHDVREYKRTLFVRALFAITTCRYRADERQHAAHRRVRSVRVLRGYRSSSQGHGGRKTRFLDEQRRPNVLPVSSGITKQTLFDFRHQHSIRHGLIHVVMSRQLTGIFKSLRIIIRFLFTRGRLT